MGERVERLPIVVTNKNVEQLIAVPQLERSTGKEQASAVCDVLRSWGLQDIVEGVCCDSTALNTGRINEACVLIENALEKDLFYLLCQQHIFELVLRAAFEIKIKHIQLLHTNVLHPYLPCQSLVNLVLNSNLTPLHPPFL
ncbi:hypothetical protein PGB90_002973 [Kerria lacca]